MPFRRLLKKTFLINVINHLHRFIPIICRVTIRTSWDLEENIRIIMLVHETV